MHVDGGVSKNQFVMQLVADLTGLSLDFPNDCDSSALGAAFLAGIAAGVWKVTRVDDGPECDSPDHSSIFFLVVTGLLVSSLRLYKMVSVCLLRLCALM